MSHCCPRPESLALWLDEGNGPGVTANHIAGCEQCGALVRELRADQEVLQSYALPDEALVAVRTQVLRRVAKQNKRPLYRWAAAAIAASILVALFLPRTPPAPPRVAARQASQAPEVRAAEPPAAITASRHKLKTKKRPAKGSSAELIAAFDRLFEENPPTAPGAPGQTVITMQTQDPTVTVILLGEITGENKGADE